LLEHRAAEPLTLVRRVDGQHHQIPVLLRDVFLVQLLDRRGLVPGGLEVGYEIEVRHF